MNLLKKMLMGGLAAMLLLGGMFQASAQENTTKKERRIYLWDVTISMVGATKTPGFPLANPTEGVGNKIYSYKESPYLNYNQAGDVYDSTRKALVESISKIADEDCQIVVLPYDREIRDVFEVSTASIKDKETIIQQVESWSKLRKAGTYTGKCLREVIDNYFKKDRLNRVILLTDGCPDTTNKPSDEEIFLQIIKEWDQRISESKYVDNRLVYVMLTDAANGSSKITENLKKKDEGTGVATVGSLDELENYVSFSLTNLSHEKVVEQNLSEFNIIVDCNVVAAFGNPDKIRCVFETSDPMIVVDPAPIAPTDGKFIIPVKFAYGSREAYRQELGNKVHSAVVKCSVAHECEDVVLEGNDKIIVDLSINAQPKAVVRISRK